MNVHIVRVFSLFFVCFALILSSASVFAREPLVIEFDEGNYPFMYNVGGAARGLYPVLVSAVFEKMGVPVIVRTKPWPRVLREASAGKVGIGGLYKNSERLNAYDFSAPIFREKLLLYVLVKKAFHYEGVESLYGRKIGVMRGWSYGDAFDEARKAGLFAVEEVGRDDININKLLLERIDVLIAAPESVAALIAERGLTGDVVSLPVPFVENDTHIAFSKGLRQKALLRRFDAALAEMKASGDYDLLVKGSVFPFRTP